MIWLTAEYLYSRRVLMNDQEILDVEKNREFYSSLFYFDESIREHAMKNGGSVEGFDGNVYGHHFVVDLDGKDLSLVIHAMRPLMREIDRLGIPYYLFFSGNKGFHLYIPKQYVEYPEEYETQWNEASKLFARTLIDKFPELTPYVDFNVYDKVRIFRYPFSLHPASSKRKLRLQYVGAQDDKRKASSKQTPEENLAAIDGIFARHICLESTVLKEIFHGINDKPEEILFALDLSCAEDSTDPAVIEAMSEPSIKNDAEFSYPYEEKHCIYKLLNDHICHQKRHKAALVLQTYWKEKGYPQPFVEGLLRAWNSGLDRVHGKGPLDEKEMLNVFKYFGRYVFTCDDEIKRTYCVPTCQMFKQKDINKEHVYLGPKYMEDYLAALKEPADNYIMLDKIWPAFRSTPIKPDRGHVTVVAAGPSVGKTTFKVLPIVKTKKG